IDVHGGAQTIRPWPGTDAEGEHPVDVGEKVVVLVDDVINSGWTAKEALTVIWRGGRPRAARLAVLIDRGHRQLPIKPTYVGKHHETIGSGLPAAAAGGFTAVAAMANTSPVNDTPDLTRWMLARAQEAGTARLLPIAAVTRGLAGEVLTDFAALRAAGAVAFS